jgi:hypothetical protein
MLSCTGAHSFSDTSCWVGKATTTSVAGWAQTQAYPPMQAPLPTGGHGANALLTARPFESEEGAPPQNPAVTLSEGLIRRRVARP